MKTIYLRFADRAAALAQLAAVLGYVSQPDADGRELVTAGDVAGIRYDVYFLSDDGIATGDGEDHVNLLWWADEASAPDFGSAVITPATPTCVFSA